MRCVGEYVLRYSYWALDRMLEYDVYTASEVSRCINVRMLYSTVWNRVLSCAVLIWVLRIGCWNMAA